MKIPTTVVTGFLGAGKTTIISHLIDYLQANDEQVAYVKNEIGDATIDNTIVEGKNIKTKELLNGCICCTLTGPFLFAIEELIEVAKPDRIIIEASGTADASALALLVSSSQKLYRDGVVTVIDVVNFEGFDDLSITAQNQTKFTDLIIFNKIELVDLDRKKAVVGYVRELNSHSPIIEAPHGKVNPELIFGLGTTELKQLLDEAQTQPHDHASSHMEEDHIESIIVNLPDKYDLQQVKTQLDNLPKSVFRVKGFIQDALGQTQMVQKVGNRIEITNYEQNVSKEKLKLMFIGFDIKSLSSQLTSIFTSSQI